MLRRTLKIGIVLALLTGGLWLAPARAAGGGGGAGAGAGGAVGALFHGVGTGYDWDWDGPGWQGNGGYSGPYRDSCIRSRLIRTPDGPQRRHVNVCR